MADIILVVLSVAGGAAATYFVTTRYVHRPKLAYTLRPAALLDRRDFGNNLTMTLRGTAVTNLAIFTLDIALNGHTDITAPMVPDDNKPTLFFPHFTAVDVRTLNNDETRFDIPLGLAAQGSLVIVNLRRLRAGSTATFQIIGTLDDPNVDIAGFEAEFYPGAIANVDTVTAGAIARPWQRRKR